MTRTGIYPAISTPPRYLLEGARLMGPDIGMGLVSLSRIVCLQNLVHVIVKSSMECCRAIFRAPWSEVPTLRTALGVLYSTLARKPGYVCSVHVRTEFVILNARTMESSISYHPTDGLGNSGSTHVYMT